MTTSATIQDPSEKDSSSSDNTSTTTSINNNNSSSSSASATATAAAAASKDEEEFGPQDLIDFKSSSSTSTDDENESENESETENEEGSDKKSKDDSNSNSNSDPIDLIAKAVSHKDEGNSHFKSGDLNLASRSYRKGTSLLKNLNKSNTGDDQVKALLISLQTNLSMVCFKQNKHKQSRDVATKALDVDTKNVKALYRRALANRKLGDADAARNDLKNALKQDPKNRAVQKELLAIKKEIDSINKKKKASLAKAFSGKGSSFLYNDREEEEKRKLAAKQAKKQAEKEATEKRKADWEDVCVQRMSRGEEAITFEDYEKDLKKKHAEEENARKKAKKEEEQKERAERLARQKNNTASKVSDSDSDGDDDDLTESELQALRGYKKTSDGRTTSYFSREQTDEEKKLLGSIAPQRLGGSASASASGSNAVSPNKLDSTSNSNNTNPSSSSSSAWNKAGTWEEKDTSDWCKSSLRSHLQDARVERGSFDGSVKKVKKLDGDASVAFVSGKKRFVFDYVAEVEYEITNEGDEVIASGTLHLPDISSTAVDDELEVEFGGLSKAPGADVKEHAVRCREDLVGKIRGQVTAFVAAFNEQY